MNDLLYSSMFVCNHGSLDVNWHKNLCNGDSALENILNVYHIMSCVTM